jgi:hypothetical protein
MPWVCKTCRKRRKKCDFMTNKNCYSPTLAARVDKLLSGPRKLVRCIVKVFRGEEIE